MAISAVLLVLLAPPARLRAVPAVVLPVLALTVPAVRPVVLVRAVVAVRVRTCTPIGPLKIGLVVITTMPVLAISWYIRILCIKPIGTLKLCRVVMLLGQRLALAV